MSVVKHSQKTGDVEYDEAMDALDALDPATATATAYDPVEIRTITELVEQIAKLEQRRDRAVHAARARGRSWGMIGLALGVSRQAARQRYGDRGTDALEHLDLTTP